MGERSSLGFLNRFGRSADLRAFDEGLRDCGIHPAQVQEGAKLAAVQGVREHGLGGRDIDYADAGRLIAACARSHEGLRDHLGAEAAEALHARIAGAVDQPHGLDADLVVLALHAKLAHPEVVTRFGLFVEER